MEVYIDGKRWLETDYLTVFKDLLVKGDFELEGGGSQTFDTILEGSFKLTGIAGLGTAPISTQAVTVMAAGTAGARRGLQIQVPAGFQGHYLEVLKGSNAASPKFAIRTAYTKNYGSFYALSGSFVRVVAQNISGGSVVYTRGSFDTLKVGVGGITVLGPTLGSLGSFTRVAGVDLKEGSFRTMIIGSFTRQHGSVSIYDRSGSYSMVVTTGTQQARVGLGLWMKPGSLTDAFHVWSKGAEMALKQVYAQTSRLWVDRSVLNVSEANFGTPFPAAIVARTPISGTAGVDKHAILLMSGTRSPQAGYMKAQQMPGSLTVFEVGSARGNLGIGTTQQPGYQVYALGSAHFNRFAGTPYFNRMKGTLQASKLLGTTLLHRVAGTTYVNRLKGTLEAPQLLGTTLLHRVVGTAYFNRARGTLQGPQLHGTTLIHKIEGDVAFANGDDQVFTGGGIGTYMITGGGYGVRLKDGYMLTVGTLAADVTPYKRGAGALVVLGTARVTEGLILGTMNHPAGYMLRSEGTVSINRVAGTPYFNRARGTFMGQFLGSYKMRRHFEFVGQGAPADAPTTTLVGNIIYEKFAIGDEVYLHSEVPADWSGTPMQLELDIIPSATQAGSVTSKWYAFMTAYDEEDGVADTYASKGDHVRMPGSAYKMRDILIPFGSSSTDIAMMKNKQYLAAKVGRVAVTLGTEVTAEPGLIHAELIYWANRLRPGTYYAY